MRSLAFSLILLLTASSPALSQHDSTYFETHHDAFHSRLYLIQKYNSLHYKFAGEVSTKDINYLPHTIPGIGVGFTYNWLNVIFPTLSG